MTICILINEQRIATEALVNISLGAGVECFLVKARADNDRPKMN